MNYSQLIEYMHSFRLGYITHSEMACAIEMWQRTIRR